MELVKAGKGRHPHGPLIELVQYRNHAIGKPLIVKVGVIVLTNPVKRVGHAATLSRLVGVRVATAVCTL